MHMQNDLQAQATEHQEAPVKFSRNYCRRRQDASLQEATCKDHILSPQHISPHHTSRRESGRAVEGSFASVPPIAE